MQLFYFVLKTGRQTVADPDGQELADETAARVHAVAVARQLMQHRESATRSWRIQVCDDYMQPLCEVFFAEVDETLLCYPEHLQASIENAVRTAAALNDAVAAVKTTLDDICSTLMQADKILASIPGPRVR